MRVLLVEDDELLGNGVRTGLMQEGYAVDWLKDGEQANLAVQTETFDVIMLDIGLPRCSGLEILKILRAHGVTTPVMMLTANGSIDTCVRHLDKGADDYLVKPFELGEVYARLRALLRRASGRTEPVLVCGDIIIDLAAHSVTKNNQRIAITLKEFSLLHKLFESTGRVLSKEQLNQTLYSWENDIESNAIEVHIHNLRKKLGSNLIRTIRGIGYMVDKVESITKEEL